MTDHDELVAIGAEFHLTARAAEAFRESLREALHELVNEFSDDIIDYGVD